MEIADEPRAGPMTVVRTRFFGKEQRLGTGGTERELDVLETCSTHVRRRQ